MAQQNSSAHSGRSIEPNSPQQNDSDLKLSTADTPPAQEQPVYPLLGNLQDSGHQLIILNYSNTSELHFDSTSAQQPLEFPIQPTSNHSPVTVNVMPVSTPQRLRRSKSRRSHQLMQFCTGSFRYLIGSLFVIAVVSIILAIFGFSTFVFTILLPTLMKWWLRLAICWGLLFSMAGLIESQ